MNKPRIRAHLARPFIVSILLLSTVAVLHFTAQAAQAYRSKLSSQTLRRDLTATAVEQCRRIRKSSDQCAFIKTNCADEEAGYISYLSLYYCRLPQARPVAFSLITIWATLLFSTIGIAASDFFCVNLSTISHIFRMSESLAGVTLLAFGNGSPDVFSTFAAMKNHSGSLAIGELIGAAGFITAVVAGSMAFIRPFKVAKRSFVRDVCFFLVAISFSMVFLANGNLELWECGVMVGFYGFYVATVVAWHFWLTRRRRRREREAASRSHYVPPGEEVEPYHDEDDAQSRNSGRIGVTNEDFINLEASNYVNPETVDEYEEEEERDKWLGELNSNMRINKPVDAERRNVFNPIRPSLVGALEFRAVLSSLQSSRNTQTLPMLTRRYSDAQYISATQEERAIGTESDHVLPGYTFAVNQGSDNAESNSGLLEAMPPQRARAVSANGVAALRLDPSVFADGDKVRGREIASRLDIPDVPSPIEEGSIMSGAGSHQSPSLLISPPASDSGGQEPETREGQAVRSRSRTNTSGFLAPPGMDDLSIVQHRSILNEPEEEIDSRVTPISRASSNKRSPRIILPTPKLPSPRQSPRHQPMTPGREDDYFGSTDLLLPPPSSSPTSVVPPGDFMDGEKPLKWWPYKILPRPEIMARVLFPTLYAWSDKSIWEKIIGLAAAPSFFLLTITLPVVEPGTNLDDITSPETRKASVITMQPTVEVVTVESPGNRIETLERPGVQRSSSHPHHVSVDTPASDQEWHRWLVMLQCFTAPLFMVLLWYPADDLRDLIRPTLFSLLGSLIALALILTTTVASRPPSWHFLLCFVGFGVSCTWISTIAGEVVAVLKAIGVIFDISDAILGLTIFAVGNSLGDLVADITVARLGYPVMALSACFGGPLLNILLGIGGSGMYAMIHGAERRQHKHPGSHLEIRPYRVQVSTTLLISAGALLVTLVGLLIAVPLNGWKMDRKIGTGLIALWCVSTAGNLIVEIGGWSDDFSHV